MSPNVKFHENRNHGLLDPEIKPGKPSYFTPVCLLLIWFCKETQNGKSAILVFFCCRTNYHQFQSLKKQHPLLRSQCHGPVVQHDMAGPLFIVSWSWNRDGGQTGFLSRDSGKLSSRFIQVVGRIGSLRLWSWGLCLAVSWGGSSFLEVLPGPLRVPLCILRLAACSVLCLQSASVTASSPPGQRDRSALKGLTWLG